MLKLGIGLVKAGLWLSSLWMFVICTGGLVIVIPGAIEMALATRRPTVQGTIQSIDFSEHQVASFRRWQKPKEYDLAVVYSYDVGATSYRGTLVRATGDKPYRMRTLKEKLSDYHVGTTVDVHYVQVDPSQSALEVGVDGVTIVVLIAFAAGAIIFLGATVTPIAMWWVSRIDRQFDGTQI